MFIQQIAVCKIEFVYIILVSNEFERIIILHTGTYCLAAVALRGNKKRNIVSANRIVIRVRTVELTKYILCISRIDTWISKRLSIYVGRAAGRI